MTAIDILNNLIPYQKLLHEISSKESATLKNKVGYVSSCCRVKSQYAFITLELDYLTNETIDQASPTRNRYCQIKFQNSNNQISVNELYCEDKSRTNDIEKIIKENKTITTALWNSSAETSFYYSKTITNYLLIADRIAVESTNCTSGDNYSPGNFSEISIDDSFIILSQLNYMNSRSLDHKNDYSLRKLEFILPLSNKIKTPHYFGQQIGEMLIEFSDSSSENNKSCGKRIEEKITQEKLSFEQK